MSRLVLVAIGNEILKGFTLNSNIHFLSTLLTKEGFEVETHITVSDHPDEIIKAFKMGDIIISTGGLGPTLDDLTKEIAAKFMDKKLIYSEQVACDIKARFGDIPSIKNQAMMPLDSHYLKNSIGTAFGICMENNGKHLILMPGVFREMILMAQNELIPYLKTVIKIKKKNQVEFHLTHKIESNIDPFLREPSDKFPAVEMGIYPHRAQLTVRFSSTDSLDLISTLFIDEFETFIFDSEDGSIEMALHDLMIKKGLTLSTAESCTGGTISSKITRISGASDYFLGGVVSYTNDVKMKVLGVNPATLRDFGAVSHECVKQMASGARSLCSSDYAIAISGIAGPNGGSEEKPVGLVYFAIASESGCEAFTVPIKIRTDREVVIELTSNYVLGALYRRVKFGQ
ncbi:MAG: nicotinamide-nucleotide amidohydrolase family protein [Rhabdochlamydiaceae bacterium]|nr:nicotinamide-nucleotide amidohydrolase family protein [Candidatus Amphrikana amoebophyrae]